MPIFSSVSQKFGILSLDALISRIVGNNLDQWQHPRDVLLNTRKLPRLRSAYANWDGLWMQSRQWISKTWCGKKKEDLKYLILWIICWNDNILGPWSEIKYIIEMDSFCLCLLFFFLVWLLEYWKLHIYGWNFISFEQNYSRENFHEALGAEW